MKSPSACGLTTGRAWSGHTRPLALAGIAVLPLSLLLLPDAGEVIYVLVALAGLFTLLRNGLALQEQRKLFLVSLLPWMFFATAALSVLLSGDYSDWFRPLKKLAELLATPFIALLLLQAKVAPRYFLLTAKISVLVLFPVALYQFTVLHNPRPGGAISPLQFGHVSLLLGYYSLIRLPIEKFPHKLLSLTAFGAGYLATLLSQSRIEWINSFFLFAALLFVWQRSGLLTKGVGWAVSAVMLLLALFAFNTSVVQSRVGTALGEYEVFQDQQIWSSSVGQRLLMWDSGLKAALKKPVFGWGVHRSQQAAVAELADPRARRAIIEHHNLHSEYVNTLAAKGLVGLASLLALLFVPVAVFVARSADPDLLVPNAGGILLCVSYAVSGLTYQAFGDDTMNVFFVIVLSYTLTAVMDRAAPVRQAHDQAGSAVFAGADMSKPR